MYKYSVPALMHVYIFAKSVKIACVLISEDIEDASL